MIVYGDKVVRWISEQTKGDYQAGAQGIGIERAGEIVAGVLYEAYRGKSILCHMAVSGPPTRDFFNRVYDYPFRQLGVEKIIAPITSENSKMLRLAEKMGFTEEGRIADADVHGDIILMTLRKANCRFLGDRYGKTKSSACA